MAKKLKPLCEVGAATAEELFLRVGVALSWWEAGQDVIILLYRKLCEDTEPLALEAFIHAPREVRVSMLKSALNAYQHLLIDGEIAKVENALKGLEKLASTRNEIAHGHVSSQSSKVDGVQVASGNYLLPVLAEKDVFERNFRFHHTTSTLDKFTEEVRRNRGDILDVWTDLSVRQQQGPSLKYSGYGIDLLATVKSVHRSELQGEAAVDRLMEACQRVKDAKN